MLTKHRIRVGIAALALVGVAGIGANVAFGNATLASAKDGQEKTTKASCPMGAKAKRFENAEAAKVFAWLRENGVKLAIEDEHIYTGALLTLSLDTGRPATSVAKLANALNLRAPLTAFCQRGTLHHFTSRYMPTALVLALR